MREYKEGTKNLELIYKIHEFLLKEGPQPLDKVCEAMPKSYTRSEVNLKLHAMVRRGDLKREKIKGKKFVLFDIPLAVERAAPRIDSIKWIYKNVFTNN